MADADLRALLNAVSQGDATAFRSLYEATSGKLFGVAIRILKRSDLAEDAVQDAFLRIWDGAQGYHPGYGTPMGWMVTIARNRSIDLLRKRTESQIDEDCPDLPDETIPDPFALAVEREDLRAFLACLKKLDGSSQRCVLLAYYYGYTHDEIARQVSAPVGTVKSRIRRGLKRVRECLKDA